MEVEYGAGATEFGPGVVVRLTGDEIATAIDAYIVAHRVYVSGPRTVSVNGELCTSGKVYVDPSGFLIYRGIRFSGSGPARSIHWSPFTGGPVIMESGDE